MPKDRMGTSMKTTKNKAKATIVKIERPNLPNVVHVGPIPFIVTPVDVINPSEAIGQVKYPDQAIEIKKGLGEHIECETLMHEILHAVLYSVGEEISSNDESFVQRVSSSLTTVLLRNKTLLKYLILISDIPDLEPPQ